MYGTPTTMENIKKRTKEEALLRLWLAKLQVQILLWLNQDDTVVPDCSHTNFSMVQT